VPLYVEHFAEQMRRADEPALPDDVVVALGRRSWPGNIRELRGAVERAVLLGAEADAVQGLEGPSDARTTGVVEHDFVTSFRAAKERAIGAWERLYLAELIRRNQANLSRAARAARMDRTHLRELLRRYGLKAEAD
jgi:DNA-binding NtrC family response regulator